MPKPEIENNEAHQKDGESQTEPAETNPSDGNAGSPPQTLTPERIREITRDWDQSWSF